MKTTVGKHKEEDMTSISTVILGMDGLEYTSQMVDKLVNSNVRLEAVVLDATPVDDLSRQLWEERTGNRLPFKPWKEILPDNVPIYVVQNHNSQEMVGIVRKLGIDLLVNGGTPRILGDDVLGAPRLGVLNVHPGLLPEYRGCTCVEWAVYQDDPVGNTAHFMSTQIDRGPIIMVSQSDVVGVSSYTDLRVKVYEDGFNLTVKAIKYIEKYGITSQSAPIANVGGSYYKPISDENFQIVLSKISNSEYLYQK
ncbi:formyltransferase family protein [Thalassospira tepidiphila]|uniref:formyltransferase family protein n=1 Tax=Thalassospira tepidiphila TaxID=393657 RepID=UPI003AA8DFCE